jgi:hypothetical protein
MPSPLDQAQARLDAYIAAEIAVLKGQRYTIDGRELWRANLGEIRAGIKEARDEVHRLQARAPGRRRAVVPRPSW